MKDFKHGYAVTTHKAQGATVDKAFTLYDGYFMDKEKAYVALSRGRLLNAIYSDKVTLGKLTFEEKQALRDLPAERKDAVESELYRTKLAQFLSRSNRKDTSQDYPLAIEAIRQNRPLHDTTPDYKRYKPMEFDGRDRPALLRRLLGQLIPTVLPDLQQSGMPDPAAGNQPARDQGHETQARDSRSRE